MRWTFALVLCAGMLMLTACQDNEARMEIQRLQLELQQQQRSGNSNSGNDELLKLLLASRENQGTDQNMDRRLNAMGDDVRAGFDSIRKLIEDNRRETDRRVGDLDDRIKTVADFERSLTSLKTAVESLESQRRGLDPNEVLSVHKEVIRLEAEVNNQRAAREAAEAEAQRLRGDIEDLNKELANTRADVEGLKGEDISRHPMYRELFLREREMKAELERARSDYENLEREYKALLERLREGVRPPRGEGEGDDPEGALDPERYRFMGTVGSVNLRGNRPSHLIITINSGQVPPEGTELLVLDSKRQRVCMVRVIRHFHMDDNPDLPVDEIGGVAIDENPTKPITQGDTVVWVRTSDDDREEREDRSGNAGERNAGGE
jgi:hypothetical protein